MAYLADVEASLDCSSSTCFFARSAAVNHEPQLLLGDQEKLMNAAGSRS